MGVYFFYLYGVRMYLLWGGYMDGNEIQFQANIESDFLSVAEREHFEERAAIIEFDAGFDREQAEELALLLVMDSRDKYQKAI